MNFDPHEVSVSIKLNAITRKPHVIMMLSKNIGISMVTFSDGTQEIATVKMKNGEVAAVLNESKPFSDLASILREINEAHIKYIENDTPTTD